MEYLVLWTILIPMFWHVFIWIELYVPSRAGVASKVLLESEGLILSASASFAASS